jgi:hypothetical protein
VPVVDYSSLPRDEPRIPVPALVPNPVRRQSYTRSATCQLVVVKSGAARASRLSEGVLEDVLRTPHVEQLEAERVRVRLVGALGAVALGEQQQLLRLTELDPRVRS